MEIKMIKRFISAAMLVALSGCGGDSGNNSNGNDSTSSAIKSNSKLSTYLADASVCNVLSSESLKSLSGGAAEVQQRASSYRENFSCTYSWPRADAAEREESMVAAMMASMTGQGPKMTMRDKMTDYQVIVAIQKSSQSADSFVPHTLTEEQITEQVAAAKKRTAERLTEQQKELAGDAANDMVERLLRKNNQNLIVDGVGDAAFWSDLATGTLQVLDGNIKIAISPMMADTKEADLENAKRVATEILK